MSMLTAQVDELREKAKLLRTHADGLNAPYVVPSTKELMALTMLDSASRMEQAAYTIESLRDRLQAATLGTEINGEMSGASHADVVCCESLKVDISGASELTYSTPLGECDLKVDCECSGASSVHSR